MAKAAKARVEHRYVLCPAGAWVGHERPYAMRVKRSGKKGKPFARCSCGTMAFLPPEFEEDHELGLTAEEAKQDYGAELVA